jgi:hypothetical protein
MDKKTVFVKTDKGDREVGGHSDFLYGDAKRILHLVDDESTVNDITKRAPPSLRDSLEETLQELVTGGFIRDENADEETEKPTFKMSTPSFKMSTPKGAAPIKLATPAKAAPSPVSQPNPSQSKPAESKSSESKGSDLDFSFITAAPSSEKPAIVTNNIPTQTDKTPIKPSAVEVRKVEREEVQIDLEPQAKLDLADKKAKLKKYDAAKERAKLEAAAKARTESEAKSVNTNDVSSNAQAIADKARTQAAENKARELAQAETNRGANAQIDANKARAQAEALAIARAKQEAERLKAGQATQTEAAEKAAKLRAYEAAKEKAKIEVATRSRIEAEINHKKEAEAVRLRNDQDALRARIESETRIKQEVEVARVKAEKEAERLRLELEATRARAEAEARRKREAEAERLRLEKERAELEVARVKAEAELKLRQEAEYRLKAEMAARDKADALSRQKESSGSNSDSAVGSRTGKYDQVDSAKKLRDSFVESFGQNKSKQKSEATDFKLETFSLIDTGKIAALTVPQQKHVMPSAGSSKVKAAIEERARKAAEAERLRAEQEAALMKVDHDNFAKHHEELETAARNKAEQEAKAKIKVEQELYRLKVEQEQHAIAEATAEAEATKLAEQQSRQFEAAQRRAAAQEQAENERLTRQSENDRISSQNSRSRAPRKSLPIGKMFTGLVLLALLAIAGLPYIWPLDEYIAPLEKEISAQIRQPVHFRKMNFVLLPMPRLELHTVTMGKNEELKIKDVVLNFDLSALFAATRSINKVQLVNIGLSTTAVDDVLPWLQTAGGIERYPVARIELSGLNIQNKDMQLPLLNGLADFDPQGKFTKASLQSADSKMIINLHAQDRLLQIELNMHDGHLPILPEINFKDFSANGIIANNEIVFSDVFAHIYGGTLTGKATLNWSKGWKLQGQINAKSLELNTLFPNFGITGELYGDVLVSMNGPTLPELDDTPRLEGSFEIKNGIVSKLDLETTARFGSRPGVSGHTDFSELAGNLKVNTHSQRYILNSITAGATSATGSIEVDEKHQLSGKFLVDIAGVNAGKVPLKLSGTPSDPTLQQGD